MKRIDTYVVKYPSSLVPGKYCYYHSFKTRVSTRKAAHRLIEEFGFDHALIVSIQDNAFLTDNCTVIKEEVFL